MQAITSSHLKGIKNITELYNKLRPFKVTYESVFYLGNSETDIPSSLQIYNKHSINTMERIGYLWEENKCVDKTDIDKKFLELWDIENLYESFNGEIPSGWNKKVYVGLHTYQGHHGFFQPDLMEVIKLTHKDVRNIKGPVYVTTEPCCPSGKLSDKSYQCYDVTRDKHYGRTVIFWERKGGSKKRKKTRKKSTKKKRRRI